MREYLPAGGPDNRADLDVAEGSTVGDLIDALGAPRRLAFAVLVDGTRADLGRSLDEGVEVTLMAPFTGGTRVRS